MSVQCLVDKCGPGIVNWDFGPTGIHISAKAHYWPVYGYGPHPCGTPGGMACNPDPATMRYGTGSAGKGPYTTVHAPNWAAYSRAVDAAERRFQARYGHSIDPLMCTSEPNGDIIGCGVNASMQVIHFLHDYLCTQNGISCIGTAASNTSIWAQEIAAAGSIVLGPGRGGGFDPGGIPGASPGSAPEADPASVADPAARRVTLRGATKQSVLDAQRAPDGKLYDPNTGVEIPEGGGHFGHRPGFEWWRTQQMAREQGWTREQVIEYENDPSHYWYEDPSSNMSHQFEMPR